MEKPDDPEMRLPEDVLRIRCGASNPAGEMSGFTGAT